MKIVPSIIASVALLPPLSNRDYPLTWEAKANEATCNGLKILVPVFAEKRISPPHSWHAAEAFLLQLNATATAEQP